MSRISLAILAVIAAAVVLTPSSAALAQRGLLKGGLVQRKYLTDEERVARGWRTRGSGISGVTRTPPLKSKNVKRRRIVRAT